MIKLPKVKRDPVEAGKLCLCRPICKSRKREWKGEIQNTSAELLVERKNTPDCIRRWPMKVYPNSPCPLFGKTREVCIKQRHVYNPPDVVRICSAPVDDKVDTTYMKYVELAKSLGAWQAVRTRCFFCKCGPCCPCTSRDYVPRDAERATMRQADMRLFDKRVKHDGLTKRTMYH